MKKKKEKNREKKKGKGIDFCFVRVEKYFETYT